MNIEPKDLIDGICEVENILPRQLLADLKGTYEKMYSFNDYLSNKKMPNRMKVDLESRYYKGYALAMNTVNKMRRKSQRLLSSVVQWAVIVGGILYLLSVFL
jgi:hypothetical protein